MKVTVRGFVQTSVCKFGLRKGSCEFLATQWLLPLSLKCANPCTAYVNLNLQFHFRFLG